MCRNRPLVFAVLLAADYGTAAESLPIDRYALVERHNPVHSASDPFSPLTVGNGEFAFTFDVTGAQTFPEYHAAGIPLGTQSQWGWHTFSNPRRFELNDVMEPWDTHGRAVKYPSRRKSAAADWLRANPHRMDLGEIGLVLLHENGTSASLADLANINQRVDMWRGTAMSRFSFDDEPVTVTTFCHPNLDAVYFRIESSLIRLQRCGLRITFSYPTGSFAGSSKDGRSPEKHTTTLRRLNGNRLDLARKIDTGTYNIRINSSSGNALLDEQAHRVTLLPKGGTEILELAVGFFPDKKTPDLPSYSDAKARCEAWWQEFWMTGGAIDFTGSADPRAAELERRVVLSQYLTAVQCAGSLPPQETGLTKNSWHGKFHLEMHWAHGVHFALWDRLHLLERSLPFYDRILKPAQQTASSQGYRGARWPKMVGPEGRESPSTVGPFLVWQQPHPIYFAELVYRQKPTSHTLAHFEKIVTESAEFMCSFLQFDEERKHYVMGPPVIPHQELHLPAETINPGFELAYWAWGIETAQRWRERLGRKRNAQWQHVLDNLADLPTSGGLYLAAESAPDQYDNPKLLTDNLSMCGVLGLTPPTRLSDGFIMRSTVRTVYEKWNWSHTWSWDFPLYAMAAARCGEPQLAVDVLLMDAPQNRCLPNGHYNQSRNLPLYLPGNGALLAATAMMAAGWDEAPDQNAPGFSETGWSVRWENLHTMP